MQTQAELQERRQTFEQLIAIMRMEGKTFDDEQIKAFEPLLNGSMDAEEHRNYLRECFEEK